MNDNPADEENNKIDNDSSSESSPPEAQMLPFQTLNKPDSNPTDQSAQQPAELKSSERSPALEVVLQWLTYVFWFWTLCVVSIVLSGSLAYFIVDTDNGSQWIIYTLSALFVLLPAAIITDHYYKRIEPPKKHGFAAIIMVINAVIACISAVGSLISATVATTSILVSSGSTDAKIVTILSSLVVAAMSTLFFLRIIHVDKLDIVHRKFGTIMAGVVGVTLLLAIAGPLTDGIKRRGDLLIEENYSSVISGISNYASENDKLPESLDDVEFTGDAKAVIETGRIKYTRITATDIKKPTTNSLGIDRYNSYNSDKLSYELCVNWEYEKGDASQYSYGGNNTYYGGDHKKGTECYNETTYSY